MIHFHNKRKIDLDQIKVILNNTGFTPKPMVKWLEIYLDQKLLFHNHVKQKVNEATKIFYQIKRLSNIKRGLSFYAIRQLYIACITLITDYMVLIWWRGQRYILDKYQKL